MDMREDLNVLYEDKYLIVCEKPAGVPSQRDKSMEYDMLSRIKNYLKIRENTEGEPFVGLVHRLDKPVGGVMVFAKTKQALTKLNEMVRNNEIKKCYRAISDKKATESGVRNNLVNYMVKDGKNNISRIVDKDEKEAKRAELYYTVLETDEEGSLIDVELITGRHHQIRLQLANIGLPLWGDSKYNTDFLKNNPQLRRFNIALYSYKLQFVHPFLKKEMKFVNIPEKYAEKKGQNENFMTK